MLHKELPRLWLSWSGSMVKLCPESDLLIDNVGLRTTFRGSRYHLLQSNHQRDGLRDCEVLVTKELLKRHAPDAVTGWCYLVGSVSALVFPLYGELSDSLQRGHTSGGKRSPERERSWISSGELSPVSCTS